jgi:hypothetical protein
MLIKKVVLEEQKRNTKMVKMYRKKINSLPKGSLSLKKIGSNEYYYLKYRDNRKVVTDYIGKDKEKVALLEKQIQKRKRCEKMLSVLVKEKKAILKILGELD